MAEAARDLSLWGEDGFEVWWGGVDVRTKAGFIREFRAHMAALKATPRRYDSVQTRRNVDAKPIVQEASEKKIWGMCPVASERTVCCNLRTIDAVENCVFGCSYCSVQTFYTDRIIFDKNFAEKLRAIPVEPDRFYHFGTGQASDALAWGNKHGILEALIEFALTHPNLLLELKTKSDNVRYLLEHDVPANVVCSWSLNPETVIANEEHFTASLESRLDAARAVADRGIGVAFHFHPMVYYQEWEHDYPELARELMRRFTASEVSFISFGAVTLIKPVIRKIRELGRATRIHQMDLTPDPHGKLTCPDDLKVEMFSAMRGALSLWHESVFMYLCMETATIWERSFGYAYDTNEEFEVEFGRRTMSKLQSLSPVSARTTEGSANK